MKRRYTVSFFILGVTSLITQVILTRELMVSFYGNEFFIGWILFVWLLGTGLAAFLFSRFFQDLLSAHRGAFITHLTLALLFPAEIFLMRLARSFLACAPGALPNLVPALFWTFGVLFPWTLLLGLQFVTSSRSAFWETSLRTPSPTPGGDISIRGYWVEILGFLFGGAAFTFYLIFQNEFKVAVFLGILNVAAAFFLNQEKRKIGAWTFIAGSIFFLSVIAWNSGRLNALSSGFRFPQEKLLRFQNSFHGNIAVTQSGSQTNFYENGLWLASTADSLSHETLVHFPLLAVEDAKRVLLIGTGFSGVVGEILKHGPERIDYVELDPALLDAVTPFLTGPLQRALKDPRVVMHFDDARHFLRNVREVYDAVIIRLPNPSTALLNRFYSAQFFEMLLPVTRHDSVIAFQMDFSPNAMSPELENLVRSVDRALNTRFPEIVLFPDEKLLILASRSPKPGLKDAMIRRYQARHLQNDRVIVPYIISRFEDDRPLQVREQLNRNLTARMNQDFFPSAYYDQLVYWISSFSKEGAAFFAQAGKWPAEVFCLVLFLMMGIVFKGLKRYELSSKRRVVFLGMAVTGFSLMTAEMIVLYGYQVFFGNLYYRLSVIITLFMAGMAGGVKLAFSRFDLRKPKEWDFLCWMHLSQVLLFAFGTLFFQENRPFMRSSIWIEPFLYFFSLAAGAFTGAQFTAANRFFMRGKPGTSESTFIYGADLLGSSLGAFCVGIWMIPAAGIQASLGILVMLHLMMVLFFFIPKNLGGKNE